MPLYRFVRVFEVWKTLFMSGIRQTFLTMVLLSGSSVVIAQPEQERASSSREVAPRQQAERASFATNRFEQREEVRQSNAPEHHSGRLSPDERRELRRQINEVGQDIYRPPR
jgi:hypothetical protein